MSESQQSRLTAVLARGPGQPDGDPRCGLEVELCLGGWGATEAPSPADPPWRVRRFWPDRPDWHGEIVRVEGGWGVRGVGGDDDEPVWELKGGSLRPGEYITLVRPSDAELVFRIVNVEAVA